MAEIPSCFPPVFQSRCMCAAPTRTAQGCTTLAIQNSCFIEGHIRYSRLVCPRGHYHISFNYSGHKANLATSTFAATLMQIVYGLEVTQPDDQYFAMVERVRDIAEDISVPGRYLVEAIPFLRYLPSWLPGMHFKRYACKAKSDIDTILERLHDASLQAKVMPLYRNS